MPQYTLRSLLILVSACCVLFGMIRWFGVEPVAIATMICALFALVAGAWSIAYVHAPQATKYLSVILFIGVSASSIAGCWLVRSRERSRYLQNSWNLVQYVRTTEVYIDAQRAESLSANGPNPVVDILERERAAQP